MKLLAALLLSSFVILPPVPGESPVIIVTVQTRGNGGERDEFIVLYNRWGQDISLSGWTLRARAAIADPPGNVRWTGSETSVIPAYGYFLVACSGYNNNQVTPDALYNGFDVGITDAASVLLLNREGEAADVVNFYIDENTKARLLDPANEFLLNGDPVSNLPHNNTNSESSNTDVGLWRKQFGAGWYQDTGNNAADFFSSEFAEPLNTLSSKPLFKIDSDRDGLTDATELALGTDPFNPDSDGDGLWDGAELIIGTDPNNPDTDGDGLIDSVDPTPLEAGAPVEFLTNYGRGVTSDIVLTPIGEFAAPNAQSSNGHQNALTNRMAAATNAIAAGDEATALSILYGILDRVDGLPSPPDWMKDGPAKDNLRSEVELLIALLLL